MKIDSKLVLNTAIGLAAGYALYAYLVNPLLSKYFTPAS